MIDASKAGDFETYESREAARIVFTISRLANRELSPWGANCFPVEYPDYCAFIYPRLLDRLGALIEDIGAYRELWAEEDALLEFSERAFSTGDVTLEERSDIDLAIVQIPAEGSYRREHLFAMERGVALHRMAVFNRTRCNRIVVMCATALKNGDEAWDPYDPTDNGSRF